MGLIWLFLGVFLVYPLTRIFYDAVTDETGRITLANFSAFFNDGFYLRALWKSLVLGLATVVASSVIGIAVAFLLVRYDFPGRRLFSYLTLIPIISPPLVGTLGFTFILGRAGSINVLLMDIFDMLKPINFLYGIHGVVLVETLHLFPMITLNVVDALGKIDPALEEAAESVGARGWRKFRTVTLPLMTPGYVAGALLVFIWTFSDFATPHPGRPGPPCRPGLSQHRAVRGPPHLSHGHRHLRAHGAPRHRLPPRGPPLGRAQGLLNPVVFA